MPQITFPYGKTKLPYDFKESELAGVLTSAIHSYIPTAQETELVTKALESPIGCPSLAKLAEGKKNIVIIASDHTRPVPSKVIMPAMLREIRKGSPDADITILISTGCHRGTTKEELIAKFGAQGSP